MREIHMCCLKTGRLKRSLLSATPNEGEIQTTTAGGLWGPYLMKVTHNYNELAG